MKEQQLCFRVTSSFWSYVNYVQLELICSRKHVLDALPYLGTSAAVGIMSDASIQSNNTINEWMLFIALIPRPDLKMLEHLQELLQHNEMPSVSLAVSTLTYTYCMQNADCTSQEVVDGIIQILEDRAAKAYSSKKYDRKTQEMVCISRRDMRFILWTPFCLRDYVSILKNNNW